VAWVGEGVLAWVREGDEHYLHSFAARKGGELLAWVREKGEHYL
jgi:hypothetical protein